MKKPETIAKAPNTRRATASAISLTGGRLFTVDHHVLVRYRERMVHVRHSHSSVDLNQW
ncbi:hypothetical protein F2Q70_00033290 [Brassica cretica]|uniref:Uncharacterized protein n=1 Tax=Brassica cretica TaxID=69181 RepID=A0A8S9FDR2_BRACR|nr:hypothetical protein F2Q70_00033290 [Brassica cretica]KAF2551571.1 hypothetical protein F2Q68_00037614 [Brassica cretica]